MHVIYACLLIVQNPITNSRCRKTRRGEKLFVLRPEKWSQTWPNVVQRLGGEFFGGWADGKKGFPLVKNQRYQWLMMVNGDIGISMVFMVSLW